MADGWLGGLLGGGSDPYELYGDLLSDTQKAALRDQQTTRGLLQAAAIFSKAGQASRLPVAIPWGEAAAAFGGGQEEALKGIMTAAQIRELQSKAKIREQMFGPEANAKMDALLKAFGMGGASTGAPAAAPATPPAGAYIPDPAKPALPMVNPTLGPVELDAGGTPAAGMPTIPLDAPGPQTGLLPPPDQVAGLSGHGVLPRIAAMQQGGGGESGAPFGEDQAPSLRLASARAPSDPRGVAPIIEEAARRYNVDPNVALKVAQSEGLAKFYGDNGKSGTAFQLYTGGGLGNEFQKETGLDPLDPKNEPAAIDWAMRNVQRTGWSPYHGAAKVGVGPRTGLPGSEDYVIPSGRGVPASMLRNVADTGGGVPGMPPVPVPPGVNPAAMNGLLIELARRNAAAEALGMGNPYGSMLSVLQGSPQYKAAIESATRGAGLPFVRREAEEKAAGTFPFEGELKRYQSALDRANKEAEMLGAARYDPAEIKVSDGRGGEVIVQGTREQKVLAANGFAVPVLGITGMTPPAKPGLPSPAATVPPVPGATTSPTPGATVPPSDTTESPPPAGSLSRTPVYPPGYAEATTIMLKERRPKAEAAVQSLKFNETAKRLLDAGIIFGYGAGFRLDAAKAKALLGWDDQRIANTESFLATQTRQVASALASGAFGSGSSITEEDRRQAANMVGQNANLDEKSLRFLVRLNETAANWEIDRYKADVKRHDPKGQLPILQIDVPPKAETQPSANQPVPVGRSQLGGKPYIKWSDGKWREEGELPGEEKR